MALGHRVWIRGRGGPAWFTLISSLSKQHLTSLLWSPHLPYSPPTPSLSLNLSLSSSPSLSPLSDWNSHIHNSWSGEQKVPNKPVEPACQQSTIVCMCIDWAESTVEAAVDIPCSNWKCTDVSCGFCQADSSSGLSRIRTMQRVNSQTTRLVWLFTSPLFTLDLTDVSNCWNISTRSRQAPSCVSDVS